MKFYYKIGLLAFLIETLTSPLRYVSFVLCSVVTFLLFFIFQYFISKKYEKSEYLLITSLIGCSLLQIPLRIWLMSNSLISLPDFLFHLLGIVMGYLFYKTTKSYRIIVLIFSLMSCGFLYFKGYEMWIHKLNFGTFTGKVESSAIYDFRLVNEQNDTLHLSDFSEEYIIADFWFTGCGICFRKFPQFQSLYEKYKNNPSIAVISINARLKNESDRRAFETIQKEGYSFPVYRLDMDDPILLELGVNSYPTVLVFNKKRNVVFRGDIENAHKCISAHH